MNPQREIIDLWLMRSFVVFEDTEGTNDKPLATVSDRIYRPSRLISTGSFSCLGCVTNDLFSESSNMSKKSSMLKKLGVVIEVTDW